MSTMGLIELTSLSHKCVSFDWFVYHSRRWPSADKIRKVSVLAIVTCHVTCLTHISSGGLAAKILPPIQDTYYSDGEEAQG